VAAKSVTSGLESIKDKRGETVSNSKGLRILQFVYGIPGLSKEQIRKLAEELGAGSSILGYGEKIVDRKLEAMERKYLK